MQDCMMGKWSGGGTAMGRVMMHISIVSFDILVGCPDLLGFLLTLGSPSFTSQIHISLTLQ